MNGTWQYGYDDENQLAHLTNYAGSTPVTWTRLVYDGRQRLRVRQEYTWQDTATNPGPGSLTLGLGRRGAAALARPGGGSSPWQLASETRYLYDGMRVIQERDGNNAPVVSYMRGDGLGRESGGRGRDWRVAGGVAWVQRRQLEHAQLLSRGWERDVPSGQQPKRWRPTTGMTRMGTRWPAPAVWRGRTGIAFRARRCML